MISYRLLENSKLTVLRIDEIVSEILKMETNSQTKKIQKLNLKA